MHSLHFTSILLLRWIARHTMQYIIWLIYRLSLLINGFTNKRLRQLWIIIMFCLFSQKMKKKCLSETKILRAWNLVSNIANCNFIFIHYKDDQIISGVFKIKKIIKIKIFLVDIKHWCVEPHYLNRLNKFAWLEDKKLLS